MLRITVHEKPATLTFQLEGGLEGPWVRELEACWQNAVALVQSPKLCVDLTGVTSVDAAGAACLGALHQQGAKFITADCLMKAVVAEITIAPRRLNGVSKPNGKPDEHPIKTSSRDARPA